MKVLSIDSAEFANYLDNEPPSHTALELQLIREGCITRPATLDHYERIDPVVLGTDRNGHRDADEKAFTSRPDVQVFATFGC